MSLSCCLAGKKSESFGVLDLTRLFPPFYCHSQVHYKLNVDVRSTEESRKTSVAFLIFQFIFTSPSFVRPLSLSTVEKCVCTFTHIYFIFIAEGRDCSCSLRVYTKLFDPCFSVDVCCISSPPSFSFPLFVCCTCSIFKLT